MYSDQLELCTYSSKVCNIYAYAKFEAMLVHKKDLRPTTRTLKLFKQTIIHTTTIWFGNYARCKVTSAQIYSFLLYGGDIRVKLVQKSIIPVET